MAAGPAERTASSWLTAGAASLAALVVSPAHADEEFALGHAPAEAAAVIAVAYDFPPPPAIVANVAVADAAVKVAMATGPAFPPPSHAIKRFAPPPDAVVIPGAAEEALARTAIRAAAVFATPGAIATSHASAGRRAHRAGSDLEADLHCLALNVYWEARSESALGRFAVAAVTLNRVAHRAFPDTICGVVHQGEELGRNRCQFSWVCDKRGNEPDHDSAWRDAERVAFSALFLNLPDPTRGALWYHADYVLPPWAETMSEATRIGRHVFYRGPLRTVENERGASG